MAESLDKRHVSVGIEELEYKHALSINVSDFVSVKFSKSNFRIWQKQMLCLIKSQMMHGMLEDNDTWRQDKSYEIVEKYQLLLKGWILGSLNEEVLLHPDLYDLSPLEIWTKLEHSYGKDDLWNRKEPVKFKKLNTDKALGNKKKLYDAALEGSWWRAKFVLKNDQHATTEVISDNGYTMLDLAIKEGNNYFVEKLLNFIKDAKQLEKLNGCGYTSLHVAAMVGNLDAAKLLVGKNRDLLYIEDEHSHRLPSFIAFNETQVNTFIYLSKESGAYLRLDNDDKVCIAVDLLTKAICTKHYDLAMRLMETFPSRVNSDVEVLTALIRNFPSELEDGEALIYPSLTKVYRSIEKRSFSLFNSLEYPYKRAESTLWSMRRSKKYYSRWLLPEIVTILLVPIAVLYPVYQLIHLLILVLLFPLFMFYFLLWKAFAFVVPQINCIEKKEKEYKGAEMFTQSIHQDHKYFNEVKEFTESINTNDEGFQKWMAELFAEMRHKHQYSSIKLDDDLLKTLILEAARLDVYAAFSLFQWFSNDPMTYSTEKGHDIMQVAVINRSTKVYKHIRPLIDARRYNTRLDTHRNNLMHLAGKLPPLVILRCTTGAALQLQRELQWFEEVTRYVEHRLHTQRNSNDETPEMVFTREHADLVKEGENWMKTTAESCSITVALIVTIVFAAAITVPGGSNQETGAPLFRKEITFTIFAISDAISLFTGATSLSVFLSVLTTRFAEKDFMVVLPRRLLIGLFLLLLSTTAMMVAFSTILFLVFCDQRRWLMAPIGGLACVPIAAIVFLQLPLMFDLFKSTYFPVFGKEQKGRSSSLKEE